MVLPVTRYKEQLSQGHWGGHEEAKPRKCRIAPRVGKNVGSVSWRQGERIKPKTRRKKSHLR